MRPGLPAGAPDPGSHRRCAPGATRPAAPFAAEARPCVPLLATGRSRCRSPGGQAQLSVRSQDAGLPASPGHTGWRCCPVAGAAREPTATERNRPHWRLQPTWLPLPARPLALPTPPSAPYLPKCPTCSKICSKLPDFMVRPCTALRSGTPQALPARGAAGTPPRAAEGAFLALALGLGTRAGPALLLPLLLLSPTHLNCLWPRPRPFGSQSPPSNCGHTVCAQSPPWREAWAAPARLTRQPKARMH